MVAIYIILIFVGIVALQIFIISIVFREEINACFERDPAAVSYLEVLFTYCGLHAIIFHRMAHFFFEKRIPFLPRLISQTARHITGTEVQG